MFFYLGGLWILEVGGNIMGCFFCWCDCDGEECWWFKIFGKGSKECLVLVIDEMMVELVRYWCEIGLLFFFVIGEMMLLVLVIG